MPGTVNNCRIRENREVAPGIFRLSLDWNMAAIPGQFLQVAVGKTYDPLLRRPLSIHDCAEGEVVLLFQAAGRGTALLSEKKPGDNLDVLGPLGNGFPLEPGGKAVLVAGGIGMAPLYYLARALGKAGREVIFLAGAKNADSLYIPPPLPALAAELRLVTDDGTAGRRGLLTEELSAVLEGTKGEVFACGPNPMLREVIRLAESRGLASHVSLEARMACGVGACQGCVVPAGADGWEKYVRACVEGPVFRGGEVML
jgi:dihydroorotate dehydrogenase electron transfer subunit